MKKIEKSAELMWAFGIIFVALGVAICSKTSLGVSMIAAPTFILHEALVNWGVNLSTGVVEYLLQGLYLIVMCCIIGKFSWKFLFTFATAVLYGYTLDLFIFIFGAELYEGVVLRWVMLIVGDIVTAFGVACFFRTFMPLQVPELFVAEIAKRFKFNLNKTKSVYDKTQLAISVVLAVTLFGDVLSFNWAGIWKDAFHFIGLGTIVTTLINSPIIAGFGVLLDKIFNPTPAFPKVKKFFET